MSPIDYATRQGVAVVTMDDGKANALSPAMLAALGAAFDRAETDAPTAVVLAGRPGRFSGGFDLGVLGAGGPEAEGMLRDGFELAERLLGFPCPVVIACTGHAVAMGSFLLCAGDYRVGASGDFRVQANEVAIGLTMPHSAVAILRHRLAPSAFDRAVVLAEAFTPANAVEAGFLDRVVDPSEVVATARSVAASFTALDPAAHRGTKARVRATLLADVRAGIDAEYAAGVTAP
jgi:enoyl-CoA hydratase